MTAPDQSAALLPCPFCGSTDKTGLTVGPAPAFWGVICYGCGCFFDCRADSDAEAIALWNTRAEVRPNHAYRVGVAVGRNLGPQQEAPDDHA